MAQSGLGGTAESARPSTSQAGEGAKRPPSIALIAQVDLRRRFPGCYTRLLLLDPEYLLFSWERYVFRPVATRVACHCPLPAAATYSSLTLLGKHALAVGNRTFYLAWIPLLQCVVFRAVAPQAIRSMLPDARFTRHQMIVYFRGEPE